LRRQADASERSLSRQHLLRAHGGTLRPQSPVRHVGWLLRRPGATGSGPQRIPGQGRQNSLPPKRRRPRALQGMTTGRFRPPPPRHPPGARSRRGGPCAAAQPAHSTRWCLPPCGSLRRPR